MPKAQETWYEQVEKEEESKFNFQDTCDLTFQEQSDYDRRLKSSKVREHPLLRYVNPVSGLVFFSFLKIPKAKTGKWYCTICRDDTTDDKKVHTELYHAKKQFSFVCPCGYGSLMEEEMFEHFRLSHSQTVDIRSPTFRPFWWTGLPCYYHHKKCLRCHLQTPLERLFISHKCVNFTSSRPIPKSLEWKQHVGRNHRPRRPFFKQPAVDAESEKDGDSNQPRFEDNSGEMASHQCQVKPKTGFASKSNEAGAGTFFPRFATPATKPQSPSPKAGLSGAPALPLQSDQEFKEPDFNLIKKYRFERRLVLDNYSDYEIRTMKDCKKVQQRGFLEGKVVDYNAIAMTEKVLLCGHYVVTDCNAQIVADIFVSPHFSCQVFSSDSDFFGYNPAKLPIVGDMVNLATTPNMMTHHLALSNMLKAGEYRITRKTRDGTGVVMKFWLENGRMKLNFD